MRAVDVLVHLTTARFDRALTYSVPDGPELRTGDIVRVPLGTRDVFAYVVSGERTADGTQKLRPIADRTGAPRAFDEEGLALAQWVAATYLCSLREALSTIVLADAVPRVVERFVPVGEAPAPDRFPERAGTARPAALGRCAGRHFPPLRSCAIPRRGGPATAAR